MNLDVSSLSPKPGDVIVVTGDDIGQEAVEEMLEHLDAHKAAGGK